MSDIFESLKKKIKDKAKPLLLKKWTCSSQLTEEGLNSVFKCLKERIKESFEYFRKGSKSWESRQNE